MKNKVFNPYLPGYEYIPDGEPHVFGERLYIFGSHDYAGGSKYCMGDYVCWSTPVDDLSDWKYEGIIYQRTQDPTNKEGKYELWAPDVIKGSDERYYLYYCLGLVSEIGVAVSDSPTGPFTFYGHVRYPKSINGGKELNEFFPFDPAVFMDDDGKIFLYYGFAGADLNLFDPPIIPSPGCMTVELESDMLTLKTMPKVLIPGEAYAKGSGYEGHGFYEASSMRKFNGIYYFIYSSEVSHELCYATSRYPDKDFTYQGVLVSSGDIGYQGNTKPVYFMGNVHGSIERIKEEYYVFYHRQTHGTETSRQGCAEKLNMLSDGSFPQVEITSCGLNGEPLIAEGIYPSYIACHLTGFNEVGKIIYGDSLKASQPYIFEEQIGDKEEDYVQYVENITDQVVIGFKYFMFNDNDKICITIRGKGKGSLLVRMDKLNGKVVGVFNLDIDSDDWIQKNTRIETVKGKHALYFDYHGEGKIAFKEFRF